MSHGPTERIVPIAAALLASSAALGCGDPPPAPLHTITFLAEADPGDPLAGVELGTTVNGHPQVFGRTGEDGVLVQRLRAPYGTTIPIHASCPEGYRAASTVPTIRFDPVRSLDPSVAARGIEITVRCPPSERDAVVIVRASGTPLVAGVPVLVDGREVAHLDAGGVAHVPLRYAPNTRFRVELAAATINPSLEPPRPAHDFAIADSDTYLVFDQPFTFNPPAPPPRRRVHRPPPAQPPPPVRRIPVRVGGGRH